MVVGLDLKVYVIRDSGVIGANGNFDVPAMHLCGTVYVIAEKAVDLTKEGIARDE